MSKREFYDSFIKDIPDLPVKYKDNAFYELQCLVIKLIGCLYDTNDDINKLKAENNELKEKLNTQWKLIIKKLESK